MRPKFVAVTAAAVAVISGCAVTSASVIRPTAIGPPAAPHSAVAAAHPAATHPVDSPYSSPDPALASLEPAGGQEQVTFNDDVDTLAGDLEIESQSPAVAAPLAFE